MQVDFPGALEDLERALSLKPDLGAAHYTWATVTYRLNDSAAALPAFLARKQAEGARCVLVITGKGKGGEGVLRRNFLRWLEMPAARALVSGYSEAHLRHGGSGAWYVFLRQT